MATTHRWHSNPTAGWRVVGLAIASSLLAISPWSAAYAVSAAWTGGGPTTNYSDVDNWDVTIVPCNIEGVGFDVTIPANSGVVTLDQDCEVSTLFLGDNTTLRNSAASSFAATGQVDVFGIVDWNGGSFMAPIAAFPGNRAIVAAAGEANVVIGAPSYSSSGRANSATVLSATGAGTVLDLSAVASIDTGFNDGNGGFTQTHVVYAADGGSIDLSGLLSTSPPARTEDRLQLQVNTGGTIDLSSLVTIAGSGGRTFIEALGGSALSLPALQTAEDLQLRSVDGGSIAMAGGSAVTYSTSGIPFTATILDATGVGSVLDLSAVVSLDTGFNDGNGGFTQTHVVYAADGGSIDLSGLLSTSPPARTEDRLQLQVSTGGTIDLSSLVTIAGSGGRTFIEALGGSAFSLPALQTAEDLQLRSVDGGSIAMAGGSAVTYSTSGIPFTATILDATGVGSVLDLSAVVSLDTGFNDGNGGFTQTHVVYAADGGSIDLSGLLSTSPPARTEDRLQLQVSTGGTIDLSSLVTIAGSGGRTFIEALGGSAFSLPALQTAEDLQLRSVDGGSIAMAGGSAVTYSTSGIPFTATILDATGAGAVLDLSAVASIDTGFDDGNGGFTQTHVVYAADGGSIDLSGLLSTSPPARTEDRLQLQVSTGGTIDLSSLVTIAGSGGRTFIEALGGSALSLPALQTAEDLQLRSAGGGSIAMAGGSSVTYSTSGIPFTATILDATGVGSILDLSAIASMDTGFNDGNGGFTQWHLVSVSDHGSIDLPGLISATGPARSEDRLEFDVSLNGALDLSGLRDLFGPGLLRFRARDAGAIAFGDLRDDPAVAARAQLRLETGDAGLTLADTLDLGTEYALDFVAAAANVAVGGDLSFAHTDPSKVELEAAVLRMNGTPTQHLEVGDIDVNILRPGADSFSIGQLIVGSEEQATLVQLVDQYPNAAAGVPEVVYLLGLDPVAHAEPAGLRVGSGSTLSLGCIDTYVFDDSVDTLAQNLASLFDPPATNVVPWGAGFVQLDVDSDGDAFPDCADNCPDDFNPGQQDRDFDGVGDTCDNCPVDGNPGQEDPDEDTFGDPCDNCPMTSNVSQSDVDRDGVGDGCDSNPVLRISQDPDDGADFSSIQDAVDSIVESGTRLEIFPGDACYLENIQLDQPITVILSGVNDEELACIDGGSGIAIDVSATAVTLPVRIRNLLIKGSIGVRALVATTMTNLHFRDISDTAVVLEGGNHSAGRLSFDSSVLHGIDVAEEASLALERTTILGMQGTAAFIDGSAEFENVLIAETADGVVLGAAAVFALRHSTLANGMGAGLDNTAGGAALVDQSIVWNHALGDLVGLACDDVSGSLTGEPDCGGVNANISSDPLLSPDYHLLEGSPALDHGPDPALFTGTPCQDLAGGPRGRDFDGDGFARIDIGAFEEENDALLPADVTNLSWSDTDTLSWDDQGIAEYHVYRGDLADLAYDCFGSLEDALDDDRTDSELVDFAVPPEGSGWFYLITADSGSRESTLGLATCIERSRLTCPALDE